MFTPITQSFRDFFFFLSHHACLLVSFDSALQKFKTQSLKTQRERKYPALHLQNVASFIAGRLYQPGDP